MAPKKKIVRKVVKKVASSSASPTGTLTPAVAEKDRPSSADDCSPTPPPVEPEVSISTTTQIDEEKEQEQEKVNEATPAEMEEDKKIDEPEEGTPAEKVEVKKTDDGSGVAPKKKVVVRKVIKKVKKMVAKPKPKPAVEEEKPKEEEVEAKTDAMEIAAAAEEKPKEEEVEAKVDTMEIAAEEEKPKEEEEVEAKADAMEIAEGEEKAKADVDLNASQKETEKKEAESDASPTEPAVDEAEKPPEKKKKMVRKVRKVKKVVVRKVPKVKEEPGAMETAKEVVGVETNGTGGEGGDVKEEGGDGAVDGMAELSERRKKRMAEIFIGGLERTATEEDVRNVFQKVGDIVEVRMMMDAKQSGKNKGYAFLRYATAAQARKAVEEFGKVEICGKLCGASAVEGDDTIFIGNIEKNWKKEDVIKLLKDAGIEKIDAVTVMPDPKCADFNRGFAFLELETNRDAQLAYKKLQKKGAFGVHKKIKVSWAKPLNEPDEEDMQKVKSVYVEGLPSTWSEERVRKCFAKFGEIERVVLSRNMLSAKRKDFAFVNYTTREAALSCVESFDNEAPENGPKANIKVSLAKPMLKAKSKQSTSKTVKKVIAKERPKNAPSKLSSVNVKASASSSMRQPVKSDCSDSSAARKSSTTVELLHVLRAQASWKQGQSGFALGGGSTASDRPYTSLGEKRPYSALGDPTIYSDPRSLPRARLDNTNPSADSLPPSSITGAPSYFQRASAEYGTGAPYSANSASSLQGSYGTLYASQSIGHAAGGGAGHAGGRSTVLAGAGGLGHAGGRGSGLAEGHGAGLTGGHGTMHASGRGAVLNSGRGTVHARGRGTVHATGRGAGHATGRGAGQATGRGAGQATGRGAGHSTGRGAGHSTGRGAGHATGPTGRGAGLASGHAAGFATGLAAGLDKGHHGAGLAGGHYGRY